MWRALHTECSLRCRCGWQGCVDCILHWGRYPHECGYLLGFDSCSLCDAPGGHGCEFSVRPVHKEVENSDGEEGQSCSSESSSSRSTDVDEVQDGGEGVPSTLDTIADSARARVVEAELLPSEPAFPIPGSALVKSDKWGTHHLLRSDDIDLEVGSEEWWDSASIFCGRPVSSKTHTAIKGPQWPRDLTKCDQCWRYQAPYRSGGAKFKGEEFVKGSSEDR